MEKMLVTQALNETKLLDGRISRAIDTGNFVAAAKLSESKVTSTKAILKIVGSERARESDSLCWRLNKHFIG